MRPPATTPADPALFFHKGDPHDPRLGETVRTAPDDYPAADVVILGLPQDEGVRRNGGRVGAALAPAAIRRMLYRLVDIPGLRLFDLGDTPLADTLEATHAAHQAVVEAVLRDGKPLVVLGGGNDTSYPDVCALAATTPGPLLAFNIDAHFDFRADVPRNSGTPYRQLLDEGHLHANRFYEIGYQPHANSPLYRAELAKRGVKVYPLADVRARGGPNMTFSPILRRSAAQSLFFGLDMDVVTAADAPGVSAPNATGMPGAEFAQIGTIAGADPRTRLFEITEVNPLYDIDDRTARLAAVTVWQFLAARTSTTETPRH